MNIAIIGPPERAVAWEAHLMPHRSVREVIIAPDIDSITDSNACIIINEGPDNLRTVQHAIKQGLHVYLVAQLPSDQQALLKTARYAEEAGVIVQFSHWPTLSQAGKWMMNTIPKPNFITINRLITPFEFQQQDSSLHEIWVDELAFCLCWVDSGIRRLDASHISTGNDFHSRLFHLFIRFDNSSTASVTINTLADQNSHHRIAADNKIIMDCDVTTQTVKSGSLSHAGQTPAFEHKSFEPSRSAEVAITQFLKAIQLKKSSAYNAHHAYELSKTIEQVESRLRRMN